MSICTHIRGANLLALSQISLEIRQQVGLGAVDLALAQTMPAPVCVYVSAYIYVCVYICVCVYIYIYIYVCIHTHTHTHTHTYTHIYTHVNACGYW